MTYSSYSFSFLLPTTGKRPNPTKGLKSPNAHARISSILYQLEPEIFSIAPAFPVEDREIPVEGFTIAEDFRVPTGKSWHITHFHYYGNTDREPHSFNVYIFADDNGEPGQVVPNGENLNKTATVIEVIPPSRVRLPEFFVAKVFKLDITEITLPAGRYWIGLDPVDYTVQDITWYIVFNTPNLRLSLNILIIFMKNHG